MREGWESKTLEKVCDKIFAGGDVPKNNLSKYKTDKYTIPIFANGEKNKGLYGYTDIPKVIEPSITVSARGTIGYSEIRNEPFFPIVRLIVLVPNQDIIDLNFLKYVVGSMEFKKSGTSIPQLTVPMIKKYKANIPPLPEQKQIVKTLDLAFGQIDQAKANLEQNLANAKELFASKLNEVFSQRGEGWEEKKLGDVCENLDNQRIPITKNKREEGKIPYYGASGIVDYVNDYIFDEDLLLVSEDGANLLARTYPIAFSISGQNWVNNHAHVLKFENMINQKFVEYYLNSIKLDDYVSGMAQPKLNQRMLNSILIPYPSINIQMNMLETIENLNASIETLQTHYQQNLNNLEELKKSILEKAFKGEL